MKLRSAALLGLLILVGGCSRQPPTPVAAQTLRVGTQNTAEARSVFEQILSTEPLLVIDWNGRAMPRLAQRWQWLDGGLALSVNLRQDVRFHDGNRVTAAAVAGILRDNRVRDTSTGFRYLKAIETPDDNTVIFRLSRPDAFLVEAIAGASIVGRSVPGRRTGPFKLLSTDGGLVARKNTSYYRGAPGIDQVDVTFYDTQRAVFAAIIRGDVDMAPEVNPESVEFLEGASQVKTFQSTRPFYIPLVFNLRHPILKNVEVRRALIQAIDRDDIVRRAMRGHAKVADDPIWPAHWAYNATVRRRSYDPTAAKARLDAAGFPVRPRAGERMASRFQLKCLFYNKDFQFERIAVLLQRQLEEVGVDLVLTGVDQATLTRLAAAGEFDTYVFQLGSGRSFDMTYRFWHSGEGMQSTGYTGVDADLERLRNSRLDSEIRIGVANLRERFFEDVPAAFLAWPETTRAVSARFDIGDHADPEVFGNLWRWQAGPVRKAER